MSAMRRWKKYSGSEITFDESLAGTLPEISLGGDGGASSLFERPFSRIAFSLFFGIATIILLLLASRVAYLGGIEGKALAAWAEENHIERSILTAPRGLILDRKGKSIAENGIAEDGSTTRVVNSPEAFAHLIGFVGGPTAEILREHPELKDEPVIGREGIELLRDETLRGDFGETLVEVSAKGTELSRGGERLPTPGENLVLTIDAELQTNAYEALREVASTHGYTGGSVIVMDVTNGEVLAMTNYPSYDVNHFNEGISTDELALLTENARSPLLNRAIAGRFAPGSTVKPYVALAGLGEEAITPEKSIFSSGQIKVENPYQKGEFSIFKDWKAHGWVDMRRALAVSSNVYFFALGGGYEDVKGLGISKLAAWYERFKFNQVTGIDVEGEIAGYIPTPERRAERRPDDPVWRLGDTYNASIGQGDVAFTPIGAMRALGFLANKKRLLKPHMTTFGDAGGEVLELSEADMRVVHEGMLMAAETGGTAQGLVGVKTVFAAKTGTAEFGKKDRIHSWFLGYAPADNPRLAVLVFLESGPRSNTVGATAAARKIVDWMEYYGGVEKVVAR